MVIRLDVYLYRDLRHPVQRHQVSDSKFANVKPYKKNNAIQAFNL